MPLVRASTTLGDEKIDTEKPPTMTFAHGRLAIFGGINRLSGSYALLRDRVIMGDLVSTKKAGPPELMDLEQRFAKVLASVNGFHVHGTKLELLTAGKVVAVFRTEEE